MAENVFDVAARGLSTGQVVTLCIFGVATTAFIVIGIRQRALQVIPFVLILGGIGAALAYGYVEQQERCVRWLAEGEVDVVTGVVQNKERHHRSTTFDVGDEQLAVHHADLSGCGYQRWLAPLSELPVGQRVRLSHRDGQILRIEHLAR